MAKPDPPKVFFFFEQREFIIDFANKDRAIAYQQLNREGRIFLNEPTKVYLPLEKGMKSVHQTSGGLAIGFASSTEAKIWAEKSIFGEQLNNSGEVYIKKNWESILSTDSSANSKPQKKPAPSNKRVQTVVGQADRPNVSTKPRREAQKSEGTKENRKKSTQRRHEELPWELSS
jgi:hypothetical protein